MSVGATLATIIAAIVVIVQIIIEAKDHTPEYTPPTFKSFFLGFGSIIFSLGGASTFPTIQNDMLHRNKFSSCVIIAMSSKFICCFILYTSHNYLLISRKQLSFSQ